ncbi:hypothetical protein J2Z21_002868 [Streptomyces griseochromogenes]|uniref:Uncharacterized protein n=1 Tax=Streptomyces griseochromogenes TaxID=68214 RepID=A0ABS4LR97_9ACTN|nr:hypothetical protein [Streptomyces griseochromogenes]MBP2049932.1 hypothetical protein [Streptomyces griseochromogenes]
MKLVEAGEGTFTERLAELIGDAFDRSPLSTAAQALSELRSVLEREQIGMPTG